MVFSIAREAVPARKVAPMGDMKAQRLYHGGFVFYYGSYVFLVSIFRKEYPLFLQGTYLIYRLCTL